ncbi:M12 family metallopeptidase [Sphingobacterium sp.]|uniref:M12 family metallopeptidase n=1 Tax=Sphingobacterium sp. TaxID=341027 RepID=UPI00289B6A4A|nr:M12 family metallopeptidase [Sphingobacterium sp.]
MSIIQTDEVHLADSIVHHFNLPSGSGISVLEKKGQYYIADDILLSEKQFLSLNSLNSSISTKSAVMTNLVSKWPNGEVPYMIANDFYDVSRINEAISRYNAQTPIRLVPKQSWHNDYVVFVNHPSASMSNLGRIGGPQQIHISTVAGYGTVMHEIGHAIGLFHEHTRSDRDEFVDVSPGVVNSIDYQKYDTNFIGFDVGFFDFNSIMMYPMSNVLKNKSDPTYYWPVNRSDFSTGDISGISYIYGEAPYIDVRLEVTNYQSTPDGSDKTYDIYVDFYQNASKTIPLTTTYSIKIYYQQVEERKSNKANPIEIIQFNSSNIVPAGVNSFKLVSGLIESRWYEYGDLDFLLDQKINIVRNSGYQF